MPAPKSAKRSKIRTVDLGRGRTASFRVVNGPKGPTVYGQIKRKKAA